MNPKLGRDDGLSESFDRSVGYCCHDKGARTTERVPAVAMVNLTATTPEEAAAEMTALFMCAPELKRKAGISPRGQKGKRPVFQWSLNWAPHEKPTHAEMFAEAKISIEATGFKGHQAVLAIHNDRSHPHIHIVVNRVDPNTGRMVKPSYSKRRLSCYAEDYERRQGKIRCRQRVVNNRRRREGKFVKYVPPIIAKAWRSTTNGKGFAMALKRSGFILARGKRCPYVVVDPYGAVQNPVRQIAGARVADIRARFSDLDPASLPNVDEAKELAAQWRQRQRVKAERRKAKAQRYRRNWTERRGRIGRPVPQSEISVQKPQRSSYRDEKKRDVPEYPKPIQASVGVSTAFHACGVSVGRKPQRPYPAAQGPPFQPSSPAIRVPTNRYPIPAPLP